MQTSQDGDYYMTVQADTLLVTAGDLVLQQFSGQASAALLQTTTGQETSGDYETGEQTNKYNY